MTELGRISGQLLESNLKRGDSGDLSFETGLLYFDVTNKRIGVKNSSPSAIIDITGTTKISSSILSGALQTTKLTIGSNSIESDIDSIHIMPLGVSPSVNLNTVKTSSVSINGSTINSIGGQNIVISANSNVTSDLQVHNILDVSNVLHTDSNLVINGKITIGDGSDTIQVNQRLDQDIIPGLSTLSLGSPGLRWSGMYMDAYHDDLLKGGLVTVGNMVLSQQKIYTTGNSGVLTVSSNTGEVIVDGLSVNGGVLSSSGIVGIGSSKMNQTGAMKIPHGTDLQRSFNSVGDMRFNTDQNYVEVYDGNNYNVLLGSGQLVTSSVMDDISYIMSLVFE